MRCRAVPISIVLAAFALVLSGCGDLNTVISADGSYRVGALVGAESLESSPFVREGDVLRPIFHSKVANDPDVVGLSVLLKSGSGVALSDEVVYKLRSARTSTDGESVKWVSRMDEVLPAFSMPGHLPAGSYYLNFRVLGTRGGLSESGVPFFYLKDSLFSVGTIRSYPPGEGPAVTAPLFPPAVRLLLEVPVEAGPELDPYIQWSFKGKRIAEGPLSEGAQRLLWQTPAAAAIHEIRAEVFPVRPSSKDAGGPGIARKLSIAVSATAPIPGSTAKEESYTRLYRFLGTLADDLSPGGVLQGIGAPRWLPGVDSYGLAVGRGEVYTLQQPLFAVSRDGAARGDVFMRLSLLDYGSLLRADFRGAEPKDSFSLALLFEEGALRLHLEAPETKSSAEFPLGGLPVSGFMELRLSMQIEPNGVSAVLSIGDTATSLSLPLALTLPYSGDGEVVFGGDPHVQGAALRYTMLLDEFRQTEMKSGF